MTLPQGLINLINRDRDDFGMYFKNTEQIVAIFQELEQENLFLITNNQEIEIDNDDINLEYNKQMQGHEKQIEVLIKEKQRLKYIIEEEKRKKRALDRVRSDNEIETVFAMLDAEVRKTCEALDMNKEASSIDMLKDLEKRIDSQLVI